MYIQKRNRYFILWFANDTKSISIDAKHKPWAHRVAFYENGGRRKNLDSCFDCTLIIGTVCISYTNYYIDKDKL
jgi:hypothetical protein